jgi:hypothetical protein
MHTNNKDNCVSLKSLEHDIKKKLEYYCFFLFQMNEFKSTPGLSSSGPLNMNGDNHSRELNDWASSGTCYYYLACFIFDTKYWNIFSIHVIERDISGCSITIKQDHT